jgi:hypothetical protein
MQKVLDKLSSSEIELMMKAPLLVCILIAGADSQIDEKELKGAMQLAKKGKTKINLAEYYQRVSEDFEDKLKILLQGLPKDSGKRTTAIEKELSQLNFITRKMSKTVAVDFHRSLQYIAKKIAESSGGVFGLRKVGEEEQEFLTLPMIKDPASY